MRTLYVSDMDGTLLDNNSHVSTESSRILSELARRGVMFTVATARTPATVEPLLAGTETRCPAIVMTGAALWDREQREMTHTRLIDPGVTPELINLFEEAGVAPFVYCVASPDHLDVYHGVEMSAAENDFYNQRRHLPLKKFHIGYKPSTRELDNTILLFGIGDSDRVTQLAHRIREQVDCSVSCYPDILSPRRSLIEVFGPGVSKARAVRDLAERIGAERIVAFGDNLNDLPMFEVADMAIAVSNAFPKVRAKADLVIGPNSADSVARYIAGSCLVN